MARVQLLAPLLVAAALGASTPALASPPFGCLTAKDASGDQIQDSVVDLGSGPRSVDLTKLRVVERATDLEITWTTSDLSRPSFGQQWVYVFTFDRGETPYRIQAIMAADSLPGPELSPDRDEFSLIINGGPATGGSAKTLSGKFDQKNRQISLKIKAGELNQTNLRYFSLRNMQTRAEVKTGNTSSTSDFIDLPKSALTTTARIGC